MASVLLYTAQIVYDYARLTMNNNGEQSLAMRGYRTHMKWAINRLINGFTVDVAGYYTDVDRCQQAAANNGPCEVPRYLAT